MAAFGDAGNGFPAGFGPADSGLRGDAKASVVFEMVPMPVGIEQANRRKTMKKFLVVLLSLGLIMAFSMTASAAPT